MALAEFDPIRRRLQSQFQQQRQLAGDALQRRFASQGMLNSGAYQKTAAQQEAELAAKEAEATQMVDFQEAMEARRRQEIQDQRQFQREERVGGQDFQRGMFNEQMGFQKETRGIENEWRAKEFAQDVKNNWLTQLVNMDADFDDPQEFQELLQRLQRLGITP